MATKQTRAVKRLASWAALAQQGSLLPRLPHSARDQPIKAVGDSDPNDPLRALRLDPHWAKDQSIIKAFAAFKLDHRNSYHWRILMTYFADAHFGKPLSGRRREWTPEKLMQLFRDVLTIKLPNPKISDAELCRQLVNDKRLSGRYKEFRPSTLRRKLPELGRFAKRQLGEPKGKRR
jgi:hypothetical protein